jgi:hypothetical protein
MVHDLFGKASLSARVIARFVLALDFANHIFRRANVQASFVSGLGAPNVTSFASCSAHVRELGRGPW